MAGEGGESVGRFSRREVVFLQRLAAWLGALCRGARREVTVLDVGCVGQQAGFLKSPMINRSPVCSIPGSSVRYEA